MTRSFLRVFFVIIVYNRGDFVAVNTDNFNNGQIITFSDVQALKSLIALECGTSRRGRPNGTGQWQSNGTISQFYSDANEAQIQKDLEIKASEISKLNKPMTYTKTQTAVSLSNGQNISLSKLATDSVNLSGISVTSGSHGCAGSCTGLCSSGCYSNCSSCTGSCTGSCSSCSGCSGCSGSCSGCSGGCQGAGCHSGAWSDTSCYAW